MAVSVWNFFRALVGSESGRWCRSCTEAIPAGDSFGRSEGVCGPCRGVDG
jgi:hypothetical protein